MKMDVEKKISQNEEYDTVNPMSADTTLDAENMAQNMTLPERKSGLADFLQAYEEKMIPQVAQNPYRCHYHLMAPVGWLNDPNGLSYFAGSYHVFFQYSPFSSNGGMKMWGHYTSKDLIHYDYAGAPLLPDESYDKDGVYSGSAIVYEGRQYIFYTGNVKEEGEHDYIHSGRGANVIRVVSEDGEHFSEKKCILTNADYPVSCTNHVRDPKLFPMPDGSFKMVLGARLQNEKGAILLYSSTDLETFSFEKMITTEKPFGYMWECPDIFELDGKRILAVCPQGVPSEAEHYQNIYQSGYFMESDGKETSYCYSLEERKTDLHKPVKTAQFVEWDMGFDFYAPQTFETGDGRRLLIAWAGVPDASYSSNPYNEDWQHCMTLPRELTFENGRIYQRPIRELCVMRKDKLPVVRDICKDDVENREEKCVLLYGGCGEVVIDGITGKVNIGCGGLVFAYEGETAVLQFTDDSGAGRKQRVAHINKLKKLQIIVDVSIVEIYINDGEVVMTSRIFSKNKDIPVEFTGQAEKMEAWILE